MDTYLPLLVALALFPLAFLVPRARRLRWGFVLPLTLAAVFLVGVATGAGPRYPSAFFAVLALTVAWRWRRAALTSP